MSLLGESGGGALLALSFALLWQRRVTGQLVVVSLQAAVAALMAAGQGAWPLAALELAWGVAGPAWLLRRIPSAAPWPEAGVMLSMVGAVLGVVCLPLGPVGIGLAVVLLAGLLIATRPFPPVLFAGLLAAQSGIVAAGLAAGADTAVLAAPGLPVLGLLWWAPWPPHRRLLLYRRADWRQVDFAACALLFLFACGLPWLGGAVAGPWRIGPPGILAALLVTLMICALRAPQLPARSPPFGWLLALGALLAVLARDPVLAWVGLAIAVLAGARPPRRRLAGLGLGLALFGSVTLPAATLPACVTLLVGLGCLVCVAPELAALALLFLLRVGAVAGSAPGLDALLLTAGLLALMLAAAGLASRTPPVPELATLGQAGAAVFAFGLDLPQARLVAVLLLVLLVLTRLALELAMEDGAPRAVALAGLAGLPPFGVFPALVLLLAATAGHAPLLLVPLLPGLAAIGWLTIRAMPSGPYRLRPSLAWMPLAAALLIGLTMPGPIGTGLRLVAERLP